MTTVSACCTVNALVDWVFQTGLSVGQSLTLGLLDSRNDKDEAQGKDKD